MNRGTRIHNNTIVYEVVRIILPVIQNEVRKDGLGEVQEVGYRATKTRRSVWSGVV